MTAAHNTIRIGALGLQFGGGQKVGDFVCYAIKENAYREDTEIAIASGDDYEQCQEQAELELDNTYLADPGTDETLRQQGFKLYFYQVVED